MKVRNVDGSLVATREKAARLATKRFATLLGNILLECKISIATVNNSTNMQYAEDMSEKSRTMESWFKKYWKGGGTPSLVRLALGSCQWVSSKSYTFF